MKHYMALLKRFVNGLAGVFGVDLVELAADSAEGGPEESVGAFVDALEDAELFELIDDDQLDRIDEQLLVDAVDRRGLGDRFDTGPLQAVERVDDNPRSVYLHLLEPGADEGAYADRLDKIFREQFSRSPRGLHVPVTELDDLQEVDPAYFTQQAAPWLREAEQGGKPVPTAGGDA